MPKKHLKRLNSPRTWKLIKDNKYITRPNPGAHSFNEGVPLAVFLRDIAKLAKNMRETRHIIFNDGVLVDGVQRKDTKFIVGFMDSVSIPSINKYCRIIFNQKGRLNFVEIDENETKAKICKVIGKKMYNKKIQLNLSDGNNVLVDKNDCATGDGILIDVPNKNVKEVIKLENGVSAMIVGGKYSGTLTRIKDIKDKIITFETKDGDFQTLKKYAFV